MPQHKVRDRVLVKLSGGRIDDGRFHVIYAWEVAEEGRWPRFGMVTSELGWGLPVRSESAGVRRVEKLRNIAFAIWLIVAFPAILKIAFALAEEGWQLWKQLLRQLFRSKGPDSTS